jgi:hypothetical protein
VDKVIGRVRRGVGGSTLKMETVRSSETMVSKHHTTGRNNPEDHFSFDRSQNLNSGTKSRASEFRMRNTDCW